MYYIFKIGEECFKFYPTTNLTRKMLDYINRVGFKFYVKDDFKIYSRLDILEKLIKDIEKSSLDREIEEGFHLFSQFLNRLPEGEYFGLDSSNEEKILE